MPLDLTGRIALVTGATAGFGLATAEAFLQAGARVVATGRRADRLGELAARHGDRLHALSLDVRDRAAVEAALRALPAAFAAVDVLVNNAGLALGLDPFDDSSEADEEVVLETNVHGLIRMTRLVLPHLSAAAHVVNLGSVAGMWAYPNGALYVTSKFAVHGFTRALREDLLGRPIRITNVAPGLVETDFSKVRFRGDEEKASAVYADVALGGPVRPEDVADCVVFALTRPPNVNVDEIVVTALAQSSGARILREG
jgi:3-hydroxy acid dehydrogenase/malonic semialdehyde reductase